MGIRVYNTMSRAKEEFVPREEGRVSIYVCGPTVYNHIHIGNARTFLTFDVVRRYLEWRGFSVTFVQNITDIDDKIITRAAELGVGAEEVARTYIDAFLEVMDDLGVAPPTVQPRATETIPEMIEMAERLIERGHAYIVDGDVYFSVRSFPRYGALSGRDIDELRAGARIGVDERKRDPLDFALWKGAKPGEPHWPSPWGDGRPGWHLECSAMSEKELGETFDFHGGASDLVFPHHENEIAQSEAATGVPFARYWLHGGLLQVDSEKMSKSLGNFALARDILAVHPASVVRLMMLQTHYRSPLDFSMDRLDEAAAAYERVRGLVRNIRWAAASGPSSGVGATTGGSSGADLVDAVERARTRFIAEMDDDFNTAGAIGVLFELVRAGNTFLGSREGGLTSDDLAVLSQLECVLVECLGVLGIELGGDAKDVCPPGVVGLACALAGYEGDVISEAVEALLALREEARSNREWATADAVRDGFAALGVAIEDTPSGPRVLLDANG